MDEAERATIRELADELEKAKRIIVMLFMAVNGQPLGAAKELELRAWIERTGATTRSRLFT